jgi:ribosomal protein S18 acetylase RimI-like enzyme
MGKNIEFREYKPSDRQSIIILMETFNKYIQSIDTEHRTEYKEDSTEYFVDKMIKQSKDKKGQILVACLNNKLIGFISGYIDKQDEDEKMEAKHVIPGVIGELFVDDNFRGQKIGKQLLIKMESYLRNQGCDIVRLAVFAPNLMARDFYKYSGYSERILYLSKKL